MNCKNLNGASGLYFTLGKVSIHQRHALKSNKVCSCQIQFAYVCANVLCFHVCLFCVTLLSKGTLINLALRNVHL